MNRPVILVSRPDDSWVAVILRGKDHLILIIKNLKILLWVVLVSHKSFSVTLFAMCKL